MSVIGINIYQKHSGMQFLNVLEHIEAMLSYFELGV